MQMKKMCAGMLCLLMLVFLSSEAFAANWRKGKRAYRSVCMECHKTRGEAGRLSLDSKSKNEWSDFFAQKPDSIHEKAWDELSESDMENLEMYFRKYAKDVNNLLGCG
jgi:cytochrome c553